MNNMYFDNQPISTVHLTTKGCSFMFPIIKRQLVIYGFAMKLFGANGAVVGLSNCLRTLPQKQYLLHSSCCR